MVKNMKTKHIAILLFPLAILASASMAVAQNYSISWFKIAGGGGTCTNGSYSLAGTIAQYDAGVMTTEPYFVTGGFWSLISVLQIPATPTLEIVPAAPGQVTISWSPASPDYRLQETLEVSSTTWSNSPSGTTNPVTVPITLPAKYYRLSSGPG
jgi:hypothetical protein